MLRGVARWWFLPWLERGSVFLRWQQFGGRSSHTRPQGVPQLGLLERLRCRAQPGGNR